MCRQRGCGRQGEIDAGEVGAGADDQVLLPQLETSDTSGDVGARYVAIAFRRVLEFAVGYAPQGPEWSQKHLRT